MGFIGTLLALHSLFRWLLLAALAATLFRAFIGYKKALPFGKDINALRHWTATIAHIQLIIGITLYGQSPVIKYFWNNFETAKHNIDNLFFGLIHLLLMLAAISILTIGSAMAKRKPTDADKYKTLLLWYAVALTVLLAAIPWPFSPLAQRPLLRPF